MNGVAHLVRRNFLLDYNYKTSYIVFMETTQHTAQALAALGHEARLDIFRLLVRAGHPGLTVGQIAEHVGLPASTLAHHLRTLVDGGLLKQEKQGRAVLNRVDFDRMNAVLAFLSDECCAGVDDIAQTSAA